MSDGIAALVETCHWLAAAGYGTSTSGNVSVRVGQEIHITATRVAMAQVAPDNVAHITLGGRPLNGMAPSKEWGFHAALYIARPDVNAVVHAHPTHAVALSTLIPAGRIVPAVTPQFVMKAGRAPVIAYHRPGSEALARAVGEACAGCGALLLQNHGLTAFGPDFKSAVAALEETEENCRQWLLTGGRGRCLTEAEMDELQAVYGGGKY